eukprot:Skav233621  [mRNA]  locus=scaffold109:327166:333386:+ [translate_table: standard]
MISIHLEDPNKEAGDFGDPLGLGQYNEEFRNKEINNGRFAMFPGRQKVNYEATWRPMGQFTLSPRGAALTGAALVAAPSFLAPSSIPRVEAHTQLSSAQTQRSSADISHLAVAGVVTSALAAVRVGKSKATRALKLSECLQA